MMIRAPRREAVPPVNNHSPVPGAETATAGGAWRRIRRAMADDSGKPQHQSLAAWRWVAAPLAGDRAREVGEVISFVTERWITLVVRLARFLAQDLRARVASSLIEAARGFGVQDARGHVLSLRITQDALADLSAGSLRKVNAVLRRFEAEGLIGKEEGRIVLRQLGALEELALASALAGTVAAALVLFLYIGERPLVTQARTPRERALGAGLALLWFVACYGPFHARLFPGAPLLDGAQVTAAGSGLPLRIPAAGRSAIDLVLEGQLAESPSGNAAPPVDYSLTLAGAGGPRVVKGTFEDRLGTRRLGRRGTATVHQRHTADVRVLSNPGRRDLTVEPVVLGPEGAQPITISAYPHPLPGRLVLGLLATALLAAVVAFDRLGPVPETDGALTLSTAAVLGTALIFWTSNAVRPDYSALIGSMIFGGPLGFIAGAALWWMAKRLIAGPAR